MNLVTLSVKQVNHVGTMDIMRKRQGSHEGSGLSVTNCPNAWGKINSHTQGTTWTLSKETGILVDFYGTIVQEDVQEELEDWGIVEGYVTHVKAFMMRLGGTLCEYSDVSF